MQKILYSILYAVNWVQGNPYTLIIAAGSIPVGLGYWAWKSAYFLRRELKEAAADSGLAKKGKDGNVIRYLKFKLIRDNNRRIIRIRITVPRGIERSAVLRFHEKLESITATEWLALENVPGESVNVYEAVRGSVGE